MIQIRPRNPLKKKSCSVTSICLLFWVLVRQFSASLIRFLIIGVHVSHFGFLHVDFQLLYYRIISRFIINCFTSTTTYFSASITSTSVFEFSYESLPLEIWKIFLLPNRQGWSCRSSPQFILQLKRKPSMGITDFAECVEKSLVEECFNVWQPLPPKQLRFLSSSSYYYNFPISF